jgi:hypothetical protein
MVRLHSWGVQAPGTILDAQETANALEDDTMPADRVKPELLGPNGQILVYAPPILIGFIGAPLALADSQPRRRLRDAVRKNWAKRKAYGV